MSNSNQKIDPAETINIWHDYYYYGENMSTPIDLKETNSVQKKHLYYTSRYYLTDWEKYNSINTNFHPVKHFG